MERNTTIDFIKGIGVFLVVLGHTSSTLRDDIYIFHMPLFFILSGIFFKANAPLKTIINHKFQKLIIPYFSFSVLIFIFYALWSGLFKLNFEYISFINILDFNGRLISTPLWFLISLFMVYLIFFFLNGKTSQLRTLFLFFILNTIVVYFSSKIEINPFHVFTSLSCLIFFTLGFKYKELLIMLINSKISSSIFLGLSIIIFYFSRNLIDGIDYEGVDFLGNYFAIFIGALSGSTLIISLGIVIKNIWIVIDKIFVFLGSKSLFIFSFHLPIFEIVRPFTKSLDTSPNSQGILISISSILLCIPTIYIIEQYFPFLIGNFKKNSPN